MAASAQTILIPYADIADLLNPDIFPEEIIAAGSPTLDTLWGMDHNTTKMFKDGAFAPYLEEGDEVYQAISADLNLDGQEEILLITSSPILNVYILSQESSGGFSIVKSLRGFCDDSHYNPQFYVETGPGWFALNSAEPSTSIDAYSFHYVYDTGRRDWFLEKVSSDSFWGYGEVSITTTSANFGQKTLESVAEMEELPGYHEITVIENDENTGLTINASYPFLEFQNKDKQKKVNDILKADFDRLLLSLSPAKTFSLDISVTLTFLTEHVISVRYDMWGSNLEGYWYFYTVIDLDKIERIKLTDIFDIKLIGDALKERNYIDDVNSRGFRPNEEKIALLSTLEDTDAWFDFDRESVSFCLYKNLLHLIWNSACTGEAVRDTNWVYIPIEDLLPQVKVNYWG